MDNIQVITSSKHEERHKENCPYQNYNYTCIASLSSMILDARKREEYCSTENFYECPMFLSKALRK